MLIHDLGSLFLSSFRVLQIFLHFAFKIYMYNIACHQDNSGKTVITLGLWDADVHREWIKAHPAKQPKHVSKDNQ